MSLSLIAKLREVPFAFVDVETTGASTDFGDRVIEIGCIELLSRNVTDRQFHSYLNPEREIDEGAAKVHGLTQRAHAGSTRPSISAATANEKVSEKPT